MKKKSQNQYKKWSKELIHYNNIGKKTIDGTKSDCTVVKYQLRDWKVLFPNLLMTNGCA
jgi:hypothetical protein